MKTTLLTAFLLISVSFCYSQNKNQVKIYYGFIHDSVFDAGSLVGGRSLENEVAQEFGLGYSRTISKKFTLTTGINLLKIKMKFSPGMASEIPDTYDDFNLISLPAEMSCFFLKYLFINSGLIIDFETSKATSSSPLSGLGYTVGIGGKYNFGRCFVYANTNFRQHVLASAQSGRNLLLFETGTRIGVGYEF